MTPKVLWSFAADQVIVDRFGKISIIGIWETITAPAYPAIHPIAFIVSGWQADPGITLMTETRVWSPGGTLLVTTGVQPFRLSEAGKGLGINQLVQLQFPQPGEYIVELLHSGLSAHQYPLRLLLGGQQ